MKRTEMMLAGLLVLVPFLTTAGAQDRDESTLIGQRADAAVKLGLQHASDYFIYRDGQPDAELELNPKAVFRFTNPVPQESDGRAQELYGAVFLWVIQGRPAVAFSILSIHSPGVPFVVHELTSLSTDRVVAERDGIRQWYPDRAGVKHLPVPDARRPAETARGRLTQMRAISRQFAASKTDGRQRTTQLRLLSKPLYRYQSSDPAIIDGAMFAFADGTDPEVLLLLEARAANGGHQWYFAAARLNILNIKLLHQEREVWEAPYLTRVEWKNRAGHYALLRQAASESGD